MRCAVTFEKRVSDVWETTVLHPNELADSDTIAQAVNSKMSVTLRILPVFEAWQFCEKSVTYVRVIDLDRDSDRVIFRGRVSEIIDSMDESGAMYQTVTCVSALDFFEDTSFFANDCAGYLVKPTDPTDGLIPYGIIGSHNSAVGGDTFRRFSYEITGNAYYAKGGTVYGSRYSVLSAMMTGGDLRKYTGGGVTSGAYTMEFRESFSGDINTLQIAEKFGRTVDTAILIGDNLRSIRVEKALQDAVYTRVRAVSGVNSDGSRETVRATNDEMYAKYGGGRELVAVNDNIKCTAPMYEKTEYGTTTRTAANLAMLAALEEFAEQEAANLSDPPVKLTISAVDLAEMGYSGYEPFEVGSSYPVICPPLGLCGKPMRITALKRRLCDGRIEQITVETGKTVVKSASSLSAMMARLEEMNKQISDSTADQVEIAQTIAEEQLEEQADGVKIRRLPADAYGDVTYMDLVSDGHGRTDLYVDNYLVGGSGGYLTVGMTKAQYDALSTHSNTTIYIVDDNGTTRVYIGDQLITQQGGGGGTIETAAVLSSEQMTYWAPDHQLVPVEFRGGAHVYYSQPPAKIVIQKQHGIIGSAYAALALATENDLYEEITLEFSQTASTGKQRLKLCIGSMAKEKINDTDVYRVGTVVICSQIDSGSELFIGSYAPSTFVVPINTQWTVGLMFTVNQLTSSGSEPLNPRQCVVYIVLKIGDSFSILGVPDISGSFFNAPFAAEFLNDAERYFALGVTGIVEPEPSNGGGGE